jgi:tripartite-type tricarboxylate transporter receptor subunit TctC
MKSIKTFIRCGSFSPRHLPHVTPRRPAPLTPARPIHIVVPYAGGSASDVVARIMFREMQKTLSQPIVDDNMPGAGSDIDTEELSHREKSAHWLGCIWLR